MLNAIKQSVARTKKEKNTKSYLPANKQTGSDLNLSFHINLLVKKVVLLDIVCASIKGFWNTKNVVSKIVAKKRIDEVTKSKVLNEASLQSVSACNSY